MNPASLSMNRRALFAALAVLLVAATGCTRSETPSPLPTRSTQPLFTNGNFEEGSLNGWTAATHLNPGITLPVNSKDDLHLQSGGSNFTSAKHAAGGPESEASGPRW